ncbi:MAG: sulfatase-like hydrolase/transferase [Bryobacteraceae bacterium]
MTGRWRDPVMALLFSNLCFLRTWNELASYTDSQSFFFHQPPARAAYLALWINVFVWAVVVWALLRLWRRATTPLARRLTSVLLFLLALVPLNALRSVSGNRLPILRAGMFPLFGVDGAAVLILVAAFGMALIATRFGRQLRAAAAVVLFCTIPLLVFNVGAAVYRMRNLRPTLFSDLPLQPLQQSSIAAPARVVWIIFDEMDYRLAFTERPSTLKMPEFDRLKTESVAATRAHTPAWSTEYSIPSLLSGRQATAVIPIGPDRVDVRFAGEDELVRWDGSQTIFATARKLGYNTAVAGWYLPYCRVLNDALSECDWRSMGNQMNSNGRAFGQLLVNENRSLFETSLLSPFGQSLTVKKRVAEVERLVALAKRDVVDRRLGLVFLHFPVPHPPAIYDRFRKTLTKANARVSGYVDSLALADRILGELREQMTRAGLWIKTTLLVTADHHWKRLVNRIPMVRGCTVSADWLSLGWEVVGSSCGETIRSAG